MIKESPNRLYYVPANIAAIPYVKNAGTLSVFHVKSPECSFRALMIICHGIKILQLFPVFCPVRHECRSFAVSRRGGRFSRATIKLWPLHNAADSVTDSIIFRVFLSTSTAPTARDISTRCNTHASRESRLSIAR